MINGPQHKYISGLGSKWTHLNQTATSTTRTNTSSTANKTTTTAGTTVSSRGLGPCSVCGKCTCMGVEVCNVWVLKSVMYGC